MEPQIKLESRVLSCLGSLTVGIDGFRGFWIPPRQQLQAFSNEPFSFVSTKVMSHHFCQREGLVRESPPPPHKKRKAEIRRNQIKELEILFVLITLNIMLHLVFFQKKHVTVKYDQIEAKCEPPKVPPLPVLEIQAPFSTRARMKSKNFELRWGWIGWFGVLHAIDLIDLPGSSRLYEHPFSVTKGWGFTMIRLPPVIILDFQQLVFIMFFDTILL